MIERVHARAPEAAKAEAPTPQVTADDGGLLGVQRKAGNQAANAMVQRKGGGAGLPDTLKSGIEHLSGYSMDDVKVHYNSTKPAALNAHAYAQGSSIHIAPGQEKHLAHEAWHVIQQGARLPEQESESAESEADEAGKKAVAVVDPSASESAESESSE